MDSLKSLIGFALFAVTLIISSCAENNNNEQPVEAADIAEGSGYDSELASKYGADDYGMKVFVLALLKKGPNRSTDSTEIAELQTAHMANIVRLAEEGKLVMAGPIMGDEDLRGIYVFDVRSIEEAKKLTESDPAIQKGSLVMELHEWYSSAAIMQIPEVHEKLAKLNP